MSSCNVKIVKFCKEEPPVKTCEETCEEIETVAKENFLDNVDKDILYFDGSIVVEDENEPRKWTEKSSAQDNAACLGFEYSMTSLSAQIPLPLKNVDQLLYNEIFIMSEGEVKILNLVPSFDEIEESGSVCVMADQIEDEEILVNSSIRCFVDGFQVSQDILSIVDENLKLVREFIVERSCVRGKLIETSLHILKKFGGFELLKTKTDDCIIDQCKSFVNWTETGDFLSHGANILLLRRLTIDKFKGRVDSWTCDINGVIVLSEHTFHQPEESQINGKTFEVQRVDRVLIKCQDVFLKTSSFFIDGCLVKEIASKSKNVVHLNPLADFPPQKQYKNHKNDWKNDLELFTMFLEFKGKREKELKKFSDQPHVKTLVRDFILSVIKGKPTNVMEFTVEFLRKLERRANDQEVIQTASRRQQQNLKK